MDQLSTYHLHQKQPEKLQFEIYDLKQYLLKNKEHTKLPHAHTFHQILWFNKGKGEHFVDFETYQVEEESVFFIAKDQIHYFDNGEDYEGILIHFNEQFLAQSEIDFFLKFNLFNNGRRSKVVLTSEAKEQALVLINMMKSELEKSTSFGHEHVIRYFLKTLLVIFERLHDNSEYRINSATSTNKQLIFWRFKELVELNFRKGLSVHEYAEFLNLSTKTLNGVTKKFVGVSPIAFISERIILEAKRLLAFSNLQINEVGYELGFEDDSYFVKFFKKHMNVTPSVYRTQTKV